MPDSSPLTWNFAIDKYINPFIPRSILHHLPATIAHFLGHRHKPQRKLGNIVVVFWTFIGVFASVLLITAVGQRVPDFRDHGAPLIVGSFGAAAVLEFYAIESPLAQPRNAIFGQIISSILGVCISKLFLLAGDRARYDSLRWVAAALSCAVATCAMVLTGTVHPPAGATAVIAVVDASSVQLGWRFPPLVMLGCALMLAVALLVNNVQRRFPVYWWSPEEVGRIWGRKETKNEKKPAEEVGKEKPQEEAAGGTIGVGDTDRSSQDLDLEAHVEISKERKIILTRGHVVLPEDMFIRPEERLVLDSLSERL